MLLVNSRILTLHNLSCLYACCVWAVCCLAKLLASDIAKRHCYVSKYWTPPLGLTCSMPCLLQVLALALLQALGVWSMAGTTHLGRMTLSLATAQVMARPCALARKRRAACISALSICGTHQACKAAVVPRLHQQPPA